MSKLWKYIQPMSKNGEAVLLVLLMMVLLAVNTFGHSNNSASAWQFRSSDRSFGKALISTERKLSATCGYETDCPLTYSLDKFSEVLDEFSTSSSAVYERYMTAKRKCHRKNKIESGGWCLTSFNATEMAYHIYNIPALVSLKNNHSFILAHEHVPADDGVLQEVKRLLKSSSDGRYKYASLNDFGAGIGQYGHALLSDDEKYRWKGYDGAGNIVEFTRGFVSYFDLTMDLALPRADWVLSLEVGEHIPNAFESKFVRNLHVHNCQGIILSWAVLNQEGFGHINNHSPEYVRRLFEALGYVEDSESGKRIRSPPNIKQLRHNYEWFRGGSVQVFRRKTPLNCSS